MTDAPAPPVPGQPVWAELFTADAERARAFYPAVVGWGCTEPDPQLGGYANFTIDGTPDGGWIAGLMGHPGDAAGSPLASAWTVYLHVDDVHATVARARAAGAPVIVEPMQVADLGWFAQVVDPSGAPVGARQPGAHRGFAAVRVPGGPYWLELHTASAFDQTVAFYEAVFGWRTAPLEGAPFPYRRLVDDAGAELAGVMDASGWAGATSTWQVYWMVDDLDAAVAAVEAGGGTVVDAPHATPYGRLATLRDPSGAGFKLAASVAEPA
ncbi:VOC family protein [Nocardioides sp. TRM66260-LWL]|uniref:VOC family protein n=1 Tax=Nocardioides sp. TRM66260-LWL TaxID=2874478 RepID=UPI001CC68B3B|nr:VOC family protein [Nocardioides sp. TRM66260-LWL]MBZ5732883.1 VOC family protein [Nocardioides sp. TRM66260-LWL]